MNKNDRELMERYIYQVVKRLPKKQRPEVALELQEMIEDMAEADGAMEKVLARLGDPAEFAKKYQDTEWYLIGPEYYDDYRWFLKVVLPCVSIVVVVISVIRGLSGADDSVATGIANVAVACISVFGGVTILFAGMERNKVRFERKKKREWSVEDLAGDHFAKGIKWTPEQLAPVPNKKALINRGDSIVGIIFIVLFSMILIFAPWLFSVIFKTGGELKIIPVFNLDQWNMILPLFILSLAIGLADEIFRLVVKHYCRAVMISNIVCGVLQIILAAFLLKVFPILNPDFASDVVRYLNREAGIMEWAAAHWDGTVVANAFLTIVVFATLLEIGTTVYKTLRYGVETV